MSKGGKKFAKASVFAALMDNDDDEDLNDSDEDDEGAKKCYIHEVLTMLILILILIRLCFLLSPDNCKVGIYPQSHRTHPTQSVSIPDVKLTLGDAVKWVVPPSPGIRAILGLPNRCVVP